MIAASLETLTLRGEQNPSIRPHWEEAVEEMSQEAYRVYRRDIADNPDVLEYFEQATPVNELDTARIGSRPSRRSQRPTARGPTRHSLGLRLDAEPSRRPRLVRRGPCAGAIREERSRA